MDIIAEAKGLSLSVSTFESFRTVNFDSIKLDAKASSLVHRALQDLKCAQKSIASFEYLLSGKTESIDIGEIAQYVTYPSAEEVQNETESGAAAQRVFLAVDSARVHCPFPGLTGVPIGLIDLPGLGELNEQTARAHMRDLDHRVSHIKLIIAANGTRANFSDSMGSNLDNLKRVQPGIRKRSDLITIAVNEFVGKEDAARHLEQDAARSVNEGVTGEDRYPIVRYSAKDEASVLKLFRDDLEIAAQKTARIDKEKMNHALEASLLVNLEKLVAKIGATVEDIRRKMPSSNVVMRHRINVVSGDIVRALGDLEADYRNGAKQESEAFEDYKTEVERIHGNVAKRIETSLLCSSKEEWHRTALGTKNHYTFFLDELDRIQCELVDAYGGLDVLYEGHLRRFKQEVIDVLLEVLGAVPSLQGISKHGGTDQALATLRNQLGAISNEECVYKAFDFLGSMVYRFHSSAFYRIESALDETMASGARASFKGGIGNVAEHNAADRERKLRDKCATSEQKVKLLEAYIIEDAMRANDAIEASLTGQRDFFRGYLADSLRFFNHYLWRADKDAFDQGVIRSIVQEYGDVLFPGEEDEKRDSSGRVLLDEAMDALDKLRGIM